MCRICVESINGSYAGRMAPPGMPKIVSVPAFSSDRIRLCAPVSCSPAAPCSLISSVPSSSLLNHGSANKKPLGPAGGEG